MNKWLKYRLKQKKLKELNTRFLNLSDAFFRLSITMEDSAKSINAFKEAYSRK